MVHYSQQQGMALRDEGSVTKADLSSHILTDEVRNSKAIGWAPLVCARGKEGAGACPVLSKKMEQIAPSALNFMWAGLRRNTAPNPLPFWGFFSHDGLVLGSDCGDTP